jgi:circadian clock protein KaiC
MQAPLEISYVADAVMLLRFFETRGIVRKAISVVKNRRGPHETTLREFELGPGGLRLGEPLTSLQGVLTGVPTLLPARGHGE